MPSSRNPECRLRKIVSGGQTGVDRAALEAAIALGIEHGGWCPQGRLAEDGTIPAKYQLAETDSPLYHVRTEQNIVDSDGTLILHWGKLTGGTLLTRRLARAHRRPLLQCDLDKPPFPAVVLDWLTSERIEVLNVAGPRESSRPGAQAIAQAWLMDVLAAVLRAD